MNWALLIPLSTFMLFSYNYSNTDEENATCLEKQENHYPSVELANSKIMKMIYKWYDFWR